MLKNLVKGSLLAGVALATGTALAQAGNPADDNRAVPGKKGSLLAFPLVELRWRDLNGNGSIHIVDELIVNTFISVSNDGGQDVDIKMYMVDGTDWDAIDAEGTLTRENPTYWDAFTGRPGLGKATAAQAVPSFLALEPGNPPGHDDNGDRVIKGFIYMWASDEGGDGLRRWNQLSGSATIINYVDGSAHEYQAYSFAAIAGNEGDTWGGGQINIGSAYDYAPDVLLLDFFADSDELGDNTALSGAGASVIVSTELALQVVDADFTNELGAGPRTTYVVFDVHDQNELGHSGADLCVTCYACLPLADIADFVFDIFFLGTDRGKARIQGNELPQGVNLCNFEAKKSALLGVQVKTMEFSTGAVARTAGVLVGQGTESGVIKYAPLGGGTPITPGGGSGTPGADGSTGFSIEKIKAGAGLNKTNP